MSQNSISPERQKQIDGAVKLGFVSHLTALGKNPDQIKTLVTKRASLKQAQTTRMRHITKTILGQDSVAFADSAT